MFPKFKTNELPELAGGRKPKLRSVTDLSSAMHSIAVIRQHRDAVEAERKRLTNNVNEEAAQNLQIAVDGESMPIEQYEAALLQAVEAYVPEHKDDIFEEGTQTARFPAGEVSWRDKNPEVELQEGVKAQEIADRLSKRANLPQSIMALLDEAGLAGKLRVKIELDFLTIKRLFKTGAMKKHQIPKGLIVTEPTEVVVVKPFTGPERSDQAA